MKQETQTKWTGKLGFESVIGDHTIIMDGKPEVGGENKGPTPKTLLLSSVSGCTGMDVAALLKKMRAEVDDFQITASGEVTTEHPQYYDKIHLVYTFKGENLQRDKIEKAVTLSQERYCGVSFMLGKAAKLTYEIVYKEVSVEA